MLFDKPLFGVSDRSSVSPAAAAAEGQLSNKQELEVQQQKWIMELNE